MLIPYERLRTAWDTGDRMTLHRAAEDMAAEGVTRDALDDALGQLRDEVRAAGADDDTEEIILGVGDRIHGWCHRDGHIHFADPAVTSPTQNNSAATDGQPVRPA